MNLLNEIFPEEEEELPSEELPASLNPKRYEEFLSKTKISEIKYWVAMDDAGKVVGTIGLYCYEKDKDEACWLGWFCVEPGVRRNGIGTKLLRLSIKQAKKREKKFLRLWTSTDPNELAAHRLYEKHGFKLVARESYADSDIEKLYYKLKL